MPHNKTNFQKEKQIVRNYIKDFDNATDSKLSEILKKYTTENYHWRGMHPFYEKHTAEDVVNEFWLPLRQAFAARDISYQTPKTPKNTLQRRTDIFFAGANDCDEGKTVWVVQMGHFLGLFDQNWLGIPSTGKMAFLRFAEFHRITEAGKIAETALFLDLISVMHQAGHYPLPPMTGAHFMYPGPRTHDGLLYDIQEPKEAGLTLAVLNQMIADLNSLNTNDAKRCPPELLAKTWNADMIWYGPCGIGASYTIERYQQQHQYPFRDHLYDKVFNGHIARIAEGSYCGFFGWPNLNNKNSGGFLGLPTNNNHAPMRVVDIYRREGNKLAENWVFIDLLHYLYEQGLDVLERMRHINRTER